jgi:hypothetical protein
MSVTSGRIMDLLAEACMRARIEPIDDACTRVFRCMTDAERLAFDFFLVRTGDPLAYEPGTTEHRFRTRVRRMIEAARPRPHRCPEINDPTASPRDCACGACEEGS